MAEGGRLWTRILSVFAATIIALACGTQYAYSAWAPQFAERMKLSSTQINLIGAIGNFGMYTAGIPIGILVDAKGPRPGVIIGGICMGIGFLAMKKSYDSGAGSVPLPLLCFFQFLTGIGTPSAFSGAVKTSAVNWPTHRGTATAMPMSAFGLGAFFFTTISSFAFPDNTSDFLLLLAVGCTVMCLGSVLFLQVIPEKTVYTALSSNDSRESNPLRRQKSEDRKFPPNRNISSDVPAASPDPKAQNGLENTDLPIENADENSSLLSSSQPEDLGSPREERKSSITHDPHLDLRGLAMFRTLDFWLLFTQLGLLTGIGLMTINNVGADANALWVHYDQNVSHEFVQEQQLMNVQIYSLASFFGRIFSGAGSDFVVRRLHATRWWCVLVSSCIFCIAQVCGTQIEKPQLLGFVSALTGLAYGFHFGVYPSLVTDSFGIRGLSQNWGCMTLSAIIGGNLFNILYGRIYDAHSIIKEDGSRICLEGVRCYGDAYWITFGASLLGIGMALLSIHHDYRKRRRARKRPDDTDRGA